MRYKTPDNKFSFWYNPDTRIKCKCGGYIEWTITEHEIKPLKEEQKKEFSKSKYLKKVVENGFLQKQKQTINLCDGCFKKSDFSKLRRIEVWYV